MPLAAIIPIAVVLVLLACVALAYALGHAPGDRMRPLQASAAEASDRTQDLAAEFFEWLRTGR